MNKIEKILNRKIVLYPSHVKDAVIEAMSEFGKICFDAGRKGMVYSPEETGDYCWIYEDFLKEIEDERRD